MSTTAILEAWRRHRAQCAKCGAAERLDGMCAFAWNVNAGGRGRPQDRSANTVEDSRSPKKINIPSYELIVSR